MVKKQFKNLNDLKRFVGEQSTNILNDKKLESILAKEMQKAVHMVVYRHYTPKFYERRKDNGGLSDTRNMKIVDVSVKGGNVVLLFENLTKGQTHFTPIYEHSLDSMHGEFITDLIEEGSGSGTGEWYREGAWSEARPFVQQTIENINRNPDKLVDAIKKAYRRVGFTIR